MVLIDWVEYGGAMDWIKESDWILWRTITVEELPIAPMRYEDTERQVNQNDIYPNICTVCDCLGAISDVTGYKFTAEQIMDIVRKWEKDPVNPFDKSIGWWLHIAVDYCRRYCNENLGMKISSISVAIWSKQHNIALSKWYTIATWHKGNSSYNIDRDDDGILIDWWVYKPSTYGHANAQFVYSWDSRLMKRDSYYWRSTNIYENKAQDKMIKEQRQFKRGFIFFPQHIMDIQKLPDHIGRHMVEWDAKNIVIAWETEMTKAIQDGYTPFSDYEWEFAIQRMLIDLSFIRNK
jgi:hypothetical protein